MNIQEANSLYNMYIKDSEECMRNGDLEKAENYRKDAISIKTDYYCKSPDLYQIGDKVDKKFLRGHIQEINKLLVKHNKCICGTCDTVKNLKDFGINNSSYTGYQYSCNDCRSIYNDMRVRSVKIKKKLNKKIYMFTKGTKIDKNLLEKSGYQTLGSLNKRLSQVNKKVCHKCLTVKKLKDFDKLGHSTSGICIDCKLNNVTESNSESYKRRANLIKNDVTIGKVIDNNLLEKYGYKSLVVLNSALSKLSTGLKVCHRCSTVRSTKDFDRKNNVEPTLLNVCKHCYNSLDYNNEDPSLDRRIRRKAAIESIKVGDVMDDDTITKVGYISCRYLNNALAQKGLKACNHCRVVKKKEDFYDSTRQRGIDGYKVAAICKECEDKCRLERSKADPIKKTKIEDLLETDKIINQNVGWICPKCNRSLNPNIKYCDCNE